MAHKFFHIEPVTKQGLASDRRSTQKLWSKLDGVREHEGGFRKRPAVTQLDATSAVVSGNAQMLYEFVHSDKPTVEIIRPDADGQYSDAGAGASTWLEEDDSVATYAGIDEIETDEATTFIYSPYDDPAASKYSFTFANQAATFGSINKLTFHVRARRADAATPTVEIIRPTGDGYYQEYNVTTIWYDYNNPPYPDTGIYYAQIDEATADALTSAIAITTSIQYDKVSVTMGDLVGAFDNITKITVTVNAISAGGSNPNLLVYSRAGSTDYQIGSQTAVTAKHPDWANYTFEATTNPATGSAWTTSEINALEVVLQRPAGQNSMYVSQVYVTVEGTPTNPSLELFSRAGGSDYSLGDAIEITSTNWTTYTLGSTINPADSAAWEDADADALELVLERDAANPLVRPEVTQVYATIEGIIGSVRTNSKLYCTHSGIKRLNETLDTFTDIDGSVTSPTCGQFDRWDATEFATYVYFTNGTDDLYFYPDASNLMDDLTTKPVGRTLATYGGMLLQGDVTASGTRVKERVQWCDTGDATNWATGTAGSIDLDETPGAVVKLKNLVERSGASYIGICVAYKETGVYHLEATGTANDEFDKRLINGSVGAYAMSSVQGYVNKQGQEVHAFLGHEGGVLNVFEWNGDTATPIGAPIRDMLDAEINYDQKANAFAVVSPEINAYVLYVATGDLSWPEVAYVYDIAQGLWARWPIPPITTAGQWLIDSKWASVIGKADALAYKLDTTTTTDDGSAAITQVFETGDLLIGEAFGRVTVHRIWLWYRDRGTCTVTASVSNNGGSTYAVTDSVALAGSDDGLEKLAIADINLHGRRPRIKLEASTVGQELDLTGITVEFERQGAR